MYTELRKTLKDGRVVIRRRPIKVLGSDNGKIFVAA
jgi:hypothetical protein